MLRKKPEGIVRLEGTQVDKACWVDHNERKTKSECTCGG